jgi:hypothetical protein
MVRLRQVVVVTTDLEAVSATLQSSLGLGEPFVDPGVGEFGLENRVFAAGASFLEVLTPTREGTAGGRYLERRGGDAGYMAIFQLGPDRDELDAARKRVADLGVRVVWQADLDADGIAGTHLHPGDVGGAIVSLDWASPWESWHWAGPAWRGGAPAGADADAGGVTSLTVAAAYPMAMAAQWASVLGVPTDDHVGDRIVLAAAGQDIRFVPLPADSGVRDEGIVEVGLALPASPTATSVAAGGVSFVVA